MNPCLWRESPTIIHSTITNSSKIRFSCRVFFSCCRFPCRSYMGSYSVRLLIGLLDLKCWEVDWPEMSHVHWKCSFFFSYIHVNSNGSELYIYTKTFNKAWNHSTSTFFSELAKSCMNHTPLLLRSPLKHWLLILLIFSLDAHFPVFTDKNSP